MLSIATTKSTLRRRYSESYHTTRRVSFTEQFVPAGPAGSLKNADPMPVVIAFDWGAVTALSTAASAVIIAVTVIVGFRQVRLTGVQLDNLRRATQLEGLMKVFDDLHNPTYLRARQFVATELSKKLAEPGFREEVALGMIWTKNAEEIHE